jgi:uncharacterized membrane protein
MQRWSYVSLGALVLAVALELLAIQWKAEWSWLNMGMPVLAAVAALAGLSCRLPLQNAAAIGGIILLLSGALLTCTTVSGFPFGALQFADKTGPKLFGRLPVAMPFWWVAILVSSRETARLMLRPWRRSRNYGFAVVALAAFLVALADLGLEPFGVLVTGQWRWTVGRTAFSWYVAPWMNFAGWIASAALILGFCAPWFISKRPAGRPPGLGSAMVWLGLNLCFLVASAWHGLWAAVLVGAVLTGLVFFLARRGARTPSPEH